ncbi:hypothetical protein QFC22_001458 [Naganishia vaughanmartiniae]|uniref:Uncharacterized protein n=1 Tax=Naganishia vaughanmartiniae TaxID=1424756 RepID=A0ACC2XHZ6_9TREE|nr:hypothetical protein QFC22_001458 [Naganishia vaughanmartiniae]
MDPSGLSRSASVRHENTPQSQKSQEHITHVASTGDPTTRTQQELIDDLYEEFEDLMPFGSLPVLTKNGPTRTLEEHRRLSVAGMCELLREIPSQRHEIPHIPSTPPPPPYVEDVLDDPRAKKFRPRGPSSAAQSSHDEHATASATPMRAVH